MAKAPKTSASKAAADTGSAPSTEAPADAAAPGAPAAADADASAAGSAASHTAPADLSQESSVAVGTVQQPPSQASDASVLDIVREAFPRTTTLVAAWRASNDSLPAALRITSKVDGFRRSGRAHSKSPVDWPLMGEDGEAVFQPAEIEQLLGEPNLTVELV